MRFWQGLWAGRYDKTSHIFLSALITFSARIFFSWQIVVAIIIVISIIKELIDVFPRRQKFDWLDILTNLATMTVVLLIYQGFIS